MTENLKNYITGLIEADGSIYVPKQKLSKSGNRNLYPSIQIAFSSKDFPLAMMIQKELKRGSLSKKKGLKAYVLTFNKSEDILFLIEVLNGRMRSPKYNKVCSLLDWLKENKSVNPRDEKAKKKNYGPEGPAAPRRPPDFKKEGFSTEQLMNNSWLSGFIDGDGCFYLRSSEKGKGTPKRPGPSVGAHTEKFECKFEISQRQFDISGDDCFPFLSDIGSFLGLSIKKRKGRDNTKNPQYRLRTSSLEQNKILINYLTKFPLYSSKYLDFLNWSKAFLLFSEKKHKTEEGKNLIKILKDSMNNKRTFFTWDHLNFK